MPFPVKEVITVVVTGAAGQIGYALLPSVARGLMLGPHQRIRLHLLDLELAQQSLDGVRMELDDCNFPLLGGVLTTSDAEQAFTGADIAILCGAFPRKEGMDRNDLLKTNALIFKKQGEILKRVAPSHCRVVVVGNPANTNAFLLATASSGGLDPKNITALTRLDHNRATNIAGDRCGGCRVKNCIIWGNHSGTQVPDVNHAVTESGKAVRAVANCDSFFDGDFIPDVQKRGAEVIKARGLSSAASAAKAIVDHVHDWIIGTEHGTHVSMAVWSVGNPYGIPPELVFSFPVTCTQGDWTIVRGLEMTEEIKRRVDATTKELEDEKRKAMDS